MARVYTVDLEEQMLGDITYDKAIEQADALKALGQTTIHLWDTNGRRPWHLAQACELGGTMRLGMSTSVWFIGKDQETGLTFKWSLDIEKREANGTGSYDIDVAECKRVLGMLEMDGRASFRAYLANCATLVQKKGDEYQAVADRQFRDAAILRDLVKG